MSKLNRLVLVVLALFSFSQSAHADLAAIMRQMSAALGAMSTDAVAPGPVGLAAAQNLKELSIDASKQAPVSDLARALEFEGLLLQVSVKANIYQRANLRSDTVMLQATVGEIRRLMAQGHGSFTR